MTKFKLKIVTPSGIYQEVEVNQLNLRTTAGQVGILAHHMPLASGIEISETSYIIDKQRHIFAIGGGFIYVNDDEINKTRIFNIFIKKSRLSPESFYKPFVLYFKQNNIK